MESEFVVNISGLLDFSIVKASNWPKTENKPENAGKM